VLAKSPDRIIDSAATGRVKRFIIILCVLVCVCVCVGFREREVQNKLSGREKEKGVVG